MIDSKESIGLGHGTTFINVKIPQMNVTSDQLILRYICLRGDVKKQPPLRSWSREKLKQNVNSLIHLMNKSSRGVNQIGSVPRLIMYLVKSFSICTELT